MYLGKHAARFVADNQAVSGGRALLDSLPVVLGKGRDPPRLQPRYRVSRFSYSGPDQHPD